MVIRMLRCFTALLLPYLHFTLIAQCSAWSPIVRSPVHNRGCDGRLTTVPAEASQRTGLHLLPESHTGTSVRPSTRLSLLASSDTESWRQYVPLAVSCFVILDILLGSPIVNLILAPMRRQTDLAAGDDEKEQKPQGVTMKGLFENISGGSESQLQSTTKKERIDSQRVAQEAIDRAENAMELRNYLERQKTDWDRMEDLRKKMDSQMDELEENLENLEKPKQESNE